MKEFKYKTSFSSLVKCVINEEKDRFLSKASLDNLKTIIPEQYQNQIDLLPISFNSCTPNLGNKNGDMIDANTALAIYKNFIGRPINTEHSRNNGAIGHIVDAAFSKFDENYAIGKGSEIIKASDIKNKKEPINLSLAAVLYRLYYTDLIDEIEESSNPDSPKYMSISASWELSFSSFNLAVGSKYLEDCEIISDEKEIEANKKYLIGEGGCGKLPNGKPVYRLLTGEVYALGIGLTNNAAGEVRGIYIENQESKASKSNLLSESFIKILKELPESGMGYQICDLTMNDDSILENIIISNCSILPENIDSSKIKDIKIKEIKSHNHKTVKCSCGKIISQYRCSSANKTEEIIEFGCFECKDKKEEVKANIEKNIKKVENNLSHLEKDDVKSNDINKNFMKLTQIKDITDANLKEISAADVSGLLDSEIQKIGVEYKEKLEQKEKAAKASAEKIEELTKAQKEVQDKLDKITADHNKLIEANKQKEQVEVFSARMQTLEDEFELNQEEKDMLAEDIKACESDEAFAKFMKKNNLFLKNKKKNKNVDKEDKKDGGKDEQKEANASINTQKVVDDALKNGEKEKVAVANAGEVKETTLADKAKSAFGVDGWELENKRKGRK